MNCPKCKTAPLNEFSVNRIRVDRCGDCNGIWFDNHELSQLLMEDAKLAASLRGGAERPQLDGKRGICPRDSSELMRVYSSIDRTVILDACGECSGVWLDGGEFDKIRSAFKS